MLNAVLNLLLQHDLMFSVLFVFLYVYRDFFAWQSFLITPHQKVE